MAARYVGIDMADIDEVRASVDAHGERYLTRVYTAHELAQSGRNPRRLAERFAAKEAVMKALACEDRLPWHSIAVASHASGNPTVSLVGPAATLARARGVTELSVSFACGASQATAVVVARAA
jgi:holo-[acyl-carrier protein] synthase